MRRVREYSLLGNMCKHIFLALAEPTVPRCLLHGGVPPPPTPYEFESLTLLIRKSPPFRRDFQMRRVRDSNPRGDYSPNTLAGCPIRPLWQLSLNHNIAKQYYDRAIMYTLCNLAKSIHDLALKHFAQQNVRATEHHFCFEHVQSKSGARFSRKTSCFAKELYI